MPVIPTACSSSLAGYRAPHLWSCVVMTATITLLCVPERAHLWVALSVTVLFLLHEVLRPLCVTFSDLPELLAVVVPAGSRAFVACLARGFKPRFPEWTIIFDCFQAVVGSALAAKGQNVVRLPNAQILRRNTEALGALLGWISCLQHGVRLQSFMHLGLQHLWLRPSSSTAAAAVTSSNTRQIVVLYFHGGGYSVLCPRFYVDFCARLIHKLRSQLHGNGPNTASISFHVLLANYRKLPEHPFPAPMDDAAAMYDYLVSTLGTSPKNIILAGDSAGAGLVLSTLRRLRDSGKMLPLGAVCACPMIDWPGEGDASNHCFVQPPLLTGVRDCSMTTTRSVRSTSISSGCETDEVRSLQFDLSGLPPILVQTGDKDLLHRQAHRLAAKARKDGVAVQLDVHANMPHVFAALPPVFMPSAQLGVARMASFVLQLLHE